MLVCDGFLVVVVCCCSLFVFRVSVVVVDVCWVCRCLQSLLLVLSFVVVCCC